MRHIVVGGISYPPPDPALDLGMAASRFWDAQNNLTNLIEWIRHVHPEADLSDAEALLKRLVASGNRITNEFDPLARETRRILTPLIEAHFTDYEPGDAM